MSILLGLITREVCTFVARHIYQGGFLKPPMTFKNKVPLNKNILSLKVEETRIYFSTKPQKQFEPFTI